MMAINEWAVILVNTASGNGWLPDGTKPLPGMGVTKAPFVNISVSKIFDLAKVPVRFF